MFNGKLSKKESRELEESTRENTQEFSLNGETFFAKVIDCYDGDTIRVNMFFRKNELKQFRIRMDGYDTPELIRTKDEEEKKYALIAKNALEKLIFGKVVRLECGKNEKYGRTLGKVFILDGSKKEMNVNEFMLINKYGYPYSGSKKTEFRELLENGFYKENIKFLPVTLNVFYKKTFIERLKEFFRKIF